MLKELMMMKLNVAAARTQILALAGCLVLFSGAASALDGIDLSAPAEENDGGGCSRLVQIKYPFLNCTNGEIGSTEGNDTWENSRQMPNQGEWLEGDGFWGPSYNEVGDAEDAEND